MSSIVLAISTGMQRFESTAPSEGPDANWGISAKIVLAQEIGEQLIAHTRKSKSWPTTFVSPFG